MLKTRLNPFVLGVFYACCIFLYIVLPWLFETAGWAPANSFFHPVFWLSLIHAGVIAYSNRQAGSSTFMLSALFLPLGAWCYCYGLLQYSDKALSYIIQEAMTSSPENKQFWADFIVSANLFKSASLSAFFISACLISALSWEKVEHQRLKTKENN